MSICNYVTMCMWYTHVYHYPLLTPAETCESVKKICEVSIYRDLTYAIAVTTEDSNQGYQVVPTVSV